MISMVDDIWPFGIEMHVTSGMGIILIVGIPQVVAAASQEVGVWVVVLTLSPLDASELGMARP